MLGKIDPWKSLRIVVLISLVVFVPDMTLFSTIHRLKNK